MTGSTRSSEAWTRAGAGCCSGPGIAASREVDLIMGRFADAHIDGFSDAELDEYEHLLDAIETDLLAWVPASCAVPRGSRHARCSAACATSISSGR